ncbi:hypothetical protein PSACC_00275 [Paramicrosporidium saccamoebae]|uniref:tRNA-splicing endonuclease subunit Sen54 N-terminal domain-containing protein n=1 Tax=Paramicrosporidium saccamoebae TaxID=1246581 RepID=A0A2H9TQ82_9FUNG|nr:hypothetical protein PSACC_00275 [Paramicrosporidium saccamoebae]
MEYPSEGEALPSRTKLWKLRFVPSMQKFIVDSHYGKISQTIGHSQDGTYYLSIPEALYLLEHERAVLDDNSTYDVVADSKFTKESDRRMQAYSKLKNLGYILSNTCEEAWSVHSPVATFRKSDPTEPLASISTADPNDPVPTCNDSSFYYISDLSSKLILELRWTEMNPNDDDVLHQFSFSCDEAII